MDKDLYQIMEKIEEKEKENAEQYKKFSVVDVIHKGKIKTIEEVNGQEIEVEKDIFEVIEKMLEDETITINYYDENINYIAGRDKDGKLYASKNPIVKDINFDKKIEDLKNNKGISLNEVKEELETIAKYLGIEKEQILAMSQYDLDQPIESKEVSDDKIKLNDDQEKKEDNGKEEQEEIKEQNEEALKNINAKQEIDADKKVDDIHTLGEILGLEPGSKLITVNSEAIQGNENTTRWTALEKKQNGTLKKVETLKQIGGRNSNKKINEINRDGSKVEEKSVQSSFAIESQLVQNGILTFRIGDAGRIEASYGQMDRTNHKEALTHELKTDHTKETTYEVREEFSYKNGTENIKDDLKELKETKKIGVKKPTLKDVDGRDDTGTLDNITNINDENIKSIVEKIKEENPEFENVFSDKDIRHYIEKISNEKGKNKNPEETYDEVVETIGEEIKHFRGKSER